MIRKIILTLFAATGAFAIGQVTNQTLANMANHTIKCRNTAGTGSPEDCTATQVTAFLNAMVGDSGSGGTKGMVPAPGAGDAAAGKFLKADGTYAVPPGSGGGTAAAVLTKTSSYSVLVGDFTGFRLFLECNCTSACVMILPLASNSGYEADISNVGTATCEVDTQGGDKFSNTGDTTWQLFPGSTSSNGFRSNGGTRWNVY